MQCTILASPRRGRLFERHERELLSVRVLFDEQDRFGTTWVRREAVDGVEHANMSERGLDRW